MGIEEDKIEQIIEAHTETVNALKEKRDEYKADAEKLGEVQKELKDAQAKISDLEEAAKQTDPYKEKYDEIKKQFDDFKSDIDKKAVHDSKVKAFKAILKDAGVAERHFDKIVKYSGVDEYELDDKGEFAKAKEILESVKKEWSDHIETKGTDGQPTPKPPKNDGSGTDDTGYAAKRMQKFNEEHYGTKVEN
jgi:DNA repair exonuclease SbcCD ATPase subunit